MRTIPRAWLNGLDAFNRRAIVNAMMVHYEALVQALDAGVVILPKPEDIADFPEAGLLTSLEDARKELENVLRETIEGSTLAELVARGTIFVVRSSFGADTYLQLPQHPGEQCIVWSHKRGAIGTLTSEQLEHLKQLPYPDWTEATP